MSRAALLRCGLLILALVLIVLGVLNGGLRDVFVKAANLIKPKYLYCYHYFEIDVPKLKKEHDPAIELLN